MTTAPTLFRLTLAVGAAALALAATALALALSTIQVGPGAPVHHLGDTVVYPSANTTALLVLALAAVGLVTLVKALRSVARQARAQRALRTALARHTRHGGLRVYEGHGPHALCAGLLQPRIYVSSTALAALGPHELEAVLAHEAHHRARRDPLRLAIATVLADALFFLPPVARLARNHALATEIDADRAAPDTSALARALLATNSDVDAERVDSLLGRPRHNRLAVLAGLAVTAGLILALLVLLLAGRTAAGHATLALPGLSRQPCVVALALFPGTLATAAALFLRRHKQP